MKNDKDVFRIALAGAHRVGKTTLAKELAKTLGVPFVQSSVSSAELWNTYGFSPTDNMTFPERLGIQEHVLKYLKTVIADNPRGVFDRSFIDLIGYLYANVDGATSNLFSTRVDKFVSDCIYNHKTSFCGIVLIQPGINVKATADKYGKVYLAKPYIETVNSNVLSIMYNYLIVGDEQSSSTVIIPRNCLTVDNRLKFIESHLKKAG